MTASAFDRLYLEAMAHHAAGAGSEAVAGMRRAAVLEPDRLEPLVALGGLAFASGRSYLALAFANRALATNGRSREALHNRALALEALGAPDRARAGHRQTLAEAPGLAVSLDRLGTTLLRLGETAAAIVVLRRACSCAPRETAFLISLGHALRAGGDHAGALSCYRDVLRLRPLDAMALLNLGGVLQEQGRAQEARHAYRQALVLDPRAAEGHHNLASAQADAATAALRRALALNPYLAAAHVDLGIRLHATGTLPEALAHYRQAVTAEPGLAPALHNAGTVLLQLGSTTLAEPWFRRASQLARTPGFRSDLLFCLCFQESPDLAAVFADHIGFDRDFARRLGRNVPPHVNDRTPGRPLRVGYVSANFHRHPVGQGLLGLFEHHDRARVHVHAYVGNDRTDDMTAQLRARADAWSPITGISDAALAERVRDDGIDILVDCIGHLPQNRLLAFARRPAPVQVGFYFYPNTSGLTALDYRITDAGITPREQARFYSEHLVRMPEIYSVFQPLPEPEQPPERAPCEVAGVFTFASFNNPAKLGPRTLAAWAEILRRCPARLALKWKGMSRHSLAVETLIRHGVPPERIDILEWAPSAYAPYLSVDCCLDPIVNGGNTTYDSLWMGVPVVTLRGEQMFARIGAALLSQVGLDELIADRIEDYVGTAVSLAGDRKRLHRIRRGLRQRLAASPVMDTRRYTRHLESAYRSMWARWCAALPPTAFDVPASASSI